MKKLLAAVALAVSMTGCSGIAGDLMPKPISRSDLLGRYAEINPIDRTATPETMDQNAQKACGLLRDGKTTDDLVTVSTGIYKSHATEVVRLLVSYGCPEFLGSFR
jgi:hypothetical protein